MSQPLVLFMFLLASIATAALISCFFQLIEITRAVERFRLDSRATILEEVKAYAQREDQVTMSGVLKVIKGEK